MNRSKAQSAALVPVDEIRALYAEVERAHDAYWVEEYDHASIESNLRRNDWVRAVRDYETSLKAHATALLDCCEQHQGARATSHRGNQAR